MNLRASLATSVVALVCSLLSTDGFAVPAKPRPVGAAEKEARRLSNRLKPISEEIWKEVAAQKFTEIYEVAKGDTLSGISQILFGDLKYWPKIWALNNTTITNPHWIKPGMKLAFHSGGLGDLPQMSLETQTDAAQGPVVDGRTMNEQAVIDAAKAAGRSVEWSKLSRQPWEQVSLSTPKGVDRDGFIKDPLGRERRQLFFEAEALISTHKVEVAGEIVGARIEGKFVAQSDTVFITPEAEGSLQVGETYTVLDEPEIVKSRKTDRSGRSRPILGNVRIIGVRDGLFIGKVIGSTGVIPRGAEIINHVQPIPRMTPIAGPLPIEGVLMVDRRLSSFSAAQFKQVFIDRGSIDGVQPGMVFRVYQYHDPATQKKLTESDFIIEADLQILMVSEEVSLAEIISSRSAISENAVAVLLTDVSDLLQTKKDRSKDLSDTTTGDELDELDALESGGLGKKEAEDLKQLEKWTEEGDQAPGEMPTDEVPAEAPADTDLEAPEPEEGTPDEVIEPTEDVPADETTDAPASDDAISEEVPETVPETAPETAPEAATEEEPLPELESDSGLSTGALPAEPSTEVPELDSPDFDSNDPPPPPPADL